MLENPNATWNHPTITSYDITEFSIRTERWRYIRYLDDSEELYDHSNDPEEWHNLAGKKEFTKIKAKLAAQLPQKPAPLREETLIALSPRHVRLYLTKEDYQQRKGEPNKASVKQK